MRATITILLLAAAFSSLQAQQSGDDLSEKNRRLFTTETFGGNVAPGWDRAYARPFHQQSGAVGAGPFNTDSGQDSLATHPGQH